MLGKELVGASTIPIILTILLKGETYGYELIKSVKEYSDGKLKWTDAMLYPVLRRMEKDHLIKSRWELLENGRKRRYYKITQEGEQVLQQRKEDWMVMLRMLGKIWNLDLSV